MVQTAIQLYSLRSVDKPLEDIIELVGETSFEGVEFANRIRKSDIEAVLAALESTELDVVGAHVGDDKVGDDLEETAELYRSLECDTFTIPWQGKEAFDSREAVSDTAHRLSSIADELDTHGISLGYHNHDHEFVDLDGVNALDLFLEKVDGVEFQPDVAHIQKAGHDPVEYLERYSDQISQVHIADCTADGESAEVGDGIVDLGACVEAGRRNGADWFIYEHDRPEDPLRSLGHGASFLANL